jgi:hypothetical protein
MRVFTGLEKPLTLTLSQRERGKKGSSKSARQSTNLPDV